MRIKNQSTVSCTAVFRLPLVDIIQSYKKSREMILKAKNIVKYYGKRKVVDHVSLELKQGEIVGL